MAPQLVSAVASVASFCGLVFGGVVSWLLRCEARFSKLETRVETLEKREA
jgi:hypothetical protein